MSAQGSSSGQRSRQPELVQFVNCYVLESGVDGRLVPEDFWINTTTGNISSPKPAADAVRDLGGCIIAPGLIDLQVNGAIGFNFSNVENIGEYAEGLAAVNKWLATTGVTSYLPTITSQKNEVYHKAIPFLAPTSRGHPDLGASVLGAHLEGPFLSPAKCGVHDRSVLRPASSYQDVENVYNLSKAPPRSVKMVTLAPEQIRDAPEVIKKLSHDNKIIVSLGHTAASYDKAREAVAAGASMVTHLFNAMPPLSHREREVNVSNIIIPLPETAEDRPAFGIIADGIHNHPSAVAMAHSLHPDGLILVTDAMHVLGLPDGTYPWQNGTQSQSCVTKSGAKVMAPNVTEKGEGKQVLAGSAVTLLECVNNFLRYIDDSRDLKGSKAEARLDQHIVTALTAATERPARLLGLQSCIGTLKAGSHADFVVLEKVAVRGGTELRLKQVWKRGFMVFEEEGYNHAYTWSNGRKVGYDG
ncbi:hypothetical protein QBC40DRAFT_289145 [Triangularia verruculosa]|uniref:Amidohydrolase-related domain-containing protein n=1 Tax=Triangularia verruculosa TaxID=2587418 RepID=A0AAN6X790_9PEZI|nr:hypothetical protein QBC40DRAFT_289145 [Triangularia verruculosa]